jgi:putative peptidoglycan lipid II flippase
MFAKRDLPFRGEPSGRVSYTGCRFPPPAVAPDRGPGGPPDPPTRRGRDDRESGGFPARRTRGPELAEVADVTADEASPSRSSTGRSTAIFATWTAVSRVAGLVREIVASALYGIQGPINAFVIAFQVPNLLRSLVADSALSAAFLPIFTELEEQGRRDEAKRLAGALAGLITMVLGGLSLIAIILAPWVMPLFGWSLDPALTNDLVHLSQLMFPIVPLLALTGLVMSILQAHGKFAPTAFAPVVWNVVILVALLCVAPFLPSDTRIYAYAVGILAGTVVQLLYLVPGLRGTGPFPFSVSFGPLVRRVLILMLPVTIGLGLINVNATVDTVIAQLVSQESVRAIDAAFRLYILPQGIFSVAVSTVLFPAISRLAAHGDLPAMRHTVSDGLRDIFFLLLPSTLFLMVLAEPITRLVFERGEFDAAATNLTSEALFFFTFGLVFNGASLLLIRAFFSLKEPWAPTKVAFLAVFLNALLDLALIVPLGTGGIPLATSVVSLVSFLLLASMLSRRIGGLEVHSLVDGFAKSLVASAFLAVIAWGTWHALNEALGESPGAQILSIGAAGIFGTAAYLAACHGMDMREMRRLGQFARPLR